MNDLEFRRQAYADPKCNDAEFVAAMNEDPERREFVDELQTFDLQLADAMKVPVPEELSERILLKQSFDEQKRQQRRTRWHLALAASVAFSAGVGLTLLQTMRPGPELGQLVMHHMYEDEPITHGIDENLSLAQINAKMAAFGTRLEYELGHIYSANFCDLNGTRGLHLVVGSEQGEVSVFIVPPTPHFSMAEKFADDRFHGRAFRHDRGSIIVVGEQGNSLDEFQKRLDASLRWESI